jgi:hypothetical protein
MNPIENIFFKHKSLQSHHWIEDKRNKEVIEIFLALLYSQRGVCET